MIKGPRDLEGSLNNFWGFHFGKFTIFDLLNSTVPSERATCAAGLKIKGLRPRPIIQTLRLSAAQNPRSVCRMRRLK